jgi:hypothetical protein
MVDIQAPSGVNRRLVTRVVFIVLLIGVSVLVSLVFTGNLSGSEATAIGTVLLVVITGGYAAATYLLLVETKKARQQEIIPMFKLDLKGVSIGKMGVAVKNIGNGPARDINATIRLHPNGGENTVGYLNVATGDFLPFPEPFENQLLTSEVIESYDKITIEGTCKDLMGKEHSFSDSYPLISPGESSLGRLMQDSGVERYLKDIKKELDGIENEIRSLRRDH